MSLIVSIPRLLSTTGHYRRRTLLVGTTRAGRDTPNALVTGLLAWENGRAGKRANAPRPLATPTSTKEVPGMTRAQDTNEQRECRHCGAIIDVIDNRQAEHVHQYGDKRCTASGQERIDVERPQAPDADQEALRAAAGFPWCDTCHRPATGGDYPVQHSTLSVDRNGQIHGQPDRADYGHEATMRQWWEASCPPLPRRA